MRGEYMKKGYRNKITDVKGVRVGHKTIAAGNVQTGVTVILPIEGESPGSDHV